MSGWGRVGAVAGEWGGEGCGVGIRLLGSAFSLSGWDVPTEKVKLSVKENIVCPVRGGQGWGRVVCRSSGPGEAICPGR